MKITSIFHVPGCSGMFRNVPCSVFYRRPLSKVFSLDELSCPQIWNIEQEKDREKEKVGGRPAKFNEKEDDRA